MSTWLKVVIIILGILFLVIAGAVTYVDTTFPKHFRKAINKALNSENQIAHEVTFDEADLRVFGTGVYITNLKISPDSASLNKADTAVGNFSLKADIEVLELTGVSLWSYLMNDAIRVGTLHLRNPQLHYNLSKKDTTTGYDGKKKKIRKIHVGEIEITQPVFTYVSAKQEKHAFDSHNINVEGLNMKRNKTEHWIFSNKNIEVDSFTYAPPGNLYKWEVLKATASLNDGTIALTEAALIPQHGKAAFMEYLGKQKTRLELKTKKLEVSGIQTDKLFGENSQVLISSVVADGFELGVYSDQRFPDVQKMKEMPQERLLNVDTGIKVDSISITNGKVVYEERRKNSDEAGQLSFTDLSLQASNITNVKAALEEKNSIIINIRSRLMGEPLFHVTYTFNMTDPSYPIHIKGDVASCNLRIVNPMVKPVADVEIVDGDSDGLYFNIYADKNSSHGDVRFLYHELNVLPLGKDEKAGLLDHLKGFIADNFVLKKHNPSNEGEEPRIGQVQFDRIPYKSIFNYSWKSLLSGLRDSLGVSKKSGEKDDKKSKKERKNGR